jgi:hypothetical protein
MSFALLTLGAGVTFPLILTSCSSTSYYLLPFYVNSTYSGLNTSNFNDLNKALNNATSSPINYLPNKYIYEPNNLNTFFNAQAFVERQKGSGAFS